MQTRKKLLSMCLGLGLSICTWAHPLDKDGNRYVFSIDLTQVKDDQVQVTLQPPIIQKDEIIYNMPKMVPGTYSISDFGKFVSDFKAADINGNSLEVERLDQNRWRILNANTIHQISYWVDDTFDTPKQEDVIFEPAGTNIEENKNFLLNTFGFIGYFDEMKHLPYQLTIEKPEGFYGSTPLQAFSATPTSDQYLVSNYMELADSPLMYNRPDTTVLTLGNTEVLVSVYNPSGHVTSRPIADNVRDILESQRSYLGGTLPVNKYAFIIYVPEKPGKSGAFGALEHSYSSVYFLPEMPAEKFNATVRDVAAHEFFHIVTPLSIHAEEIGDFDYINPKMSEHLWLYEGVTEYFASHVQAYEKLISPDEYLDKLREYIFISRKYYNDTLPFTEMSRYVLTKHGKEYGNVYQKGALIGLALDIRLRELSGGNYGLRNLMADLSKTYGKNQSFKDDELFDKITALTHPAIREFFTRYVEGPEPLPLQEIFEKVGIAYEPAYKTINSYGSFAYEYRAETGKIIITETHDMDLFGRETGFRQGDQLLAMYGITITKENVNHILKEELQKAKPGDKIIFTVGRQNGDGKIKKKKLKGRVSTLTREVLPVLKTVPAATEQQLQLRNAWLNG